MNKTESTPGTSNGPTITAKDKVQPEWNIIPPDHGSITAIAKAILEKTLKNPRVDKQDKS